MQQSSIVHQATQDHRPAPQPEQLLELLKAAADSLRLQILRALHGESFGVLELSQIFAVRQSAMSHHLKILATAGVVKTRREGNTIFYYRPPLQNNDNFHELKTVLLQNVDRVLLPDSVAEQIALIRHARAHASQAFFDKHADDFQEKQGLIVEHKDYEGSLQDLLRSLNLSQAATVMEIGPGEGHFLYMLAKQFDQVIAVDNSAQMLEKAKVHMGKKNITNIQYIHGDPVVAVQQQLTTDLLVLNMVLHHMSSPAHEFQNFKQLLSPQGTLLLADLTQHDQNWARDNCGDLWLGFNPDDLQQWAHDAGLNKGQSIFLTLKNGFQIQMHLFTKP